MGSEVILRINSWCRENADIKTDKKQVYDERGERHTLEYIRLPICFDCETYSFRDRGEKRAVMWAWCVCLGETCFIGREWKDFIEFCEVLSEGLSLNDYRRVLIYVHNLAYDFQFFRRWIPVTKVFALDSRKPVYALTAWGIEFRCSYILTGYSLEKVGEHLTKHNIKKLVGAIDYTLPRHPKTPLTEIELDYLKHDCLVVCAHIEECIEKDGGIQKIPLTKTGYVRKFARQACFRDKSKPVKKDFSRLRYRDMITRLTLDSYLYDTARKAFQGGYTHANPWYSTHGPYENVASYDFTSSYPAVMVSELFPMTAPQFIDHAMTKEEFNDYIRRYSCIFNVDITNLCATFLQDNYISESHALITGERQISNGRVVRAEKITLVLTEVDFKIIRKTYKWDKIYIYGFMYFGRNYLPKPLIEVTMNLYRDKTTLKGVEGKEQEYLSSKELLNSMYGMMVQNPLRPSIPYDTEQGQWGYDKGDGLRVLEIEPDKEEGLQKYNEDKNRFLFYLWGIYVTAYARRNLWSGILECNTDYLYSDTDSLKILNHEKHKAYFEKYNSTITWQIEQCLKYYELPIDWAKPRTVKGVEKPLGVWDYEGNYKRFKTLGAKRYMVQTEEGYSLTVAGLNKKTAIPWILEEAKRRNVDPFDIFTDTLNIPEGAAGKTLPFYIDTETTGKVKDYLGNGYIYHELSSVCLEEAPYSLSLSQTYIQYIKFLMEGHL